MGINYLHSELLCIQMPIYESITAIPTYAHLLTLVNRYAAHVGLAEMTIAGHAGSHGRLFKRLRAGLGCNVSTYNAVMAWFSDNWPADLEWPTSLERPTKSAAKNGVAA